MADGLTILLLASLVVAYADATGQKSPTPDSKPTRTPAASTVATATPQPSPIFSEILPILKQKTRVPLRLPWYVPFSGQKPQESLKKDEGEENLYATIDEASEKSYAIQLAFGEDCEGAHACREGGLTGSTVFRDQYPERPKVRVKLRSGVSGKFVDAVCGVYCDESILYWSESGYHYSVSGKAATKGDLARIANSAIEIALAQAKAAQSAASGASKQIP